jgi:hypothetical protein
MIGWLSRFDRRKAPAPAGWQTITNPVAREMAEELYRLSGLRTNPDKPDYEIEALDVDWHYRDWVRQRLREMQFFTRLDSGLDSLPDIRLVVPALLRPLESMLYPKSQDALLWHLARNLEWYLSKPGAVPAVKWRTWVWLSVIPILLAAQMILLVRVGLHGNITMTSQVGLITGFLMPVVMGIFAGILRAGELPGSGKFRIHAAELYRYLVELHT